jgi:signal transduction histidine kinase
MSPPRSIRLLDAVALLIAIGAGVAGVVVWNNGTVSLGLTLEERGGRVFVDDITPDGNALRSYLFPDAPIVKITTVDGSTVQHGPTLREIAEELADDFGIPQSDVWPEGLPEGLDFYGGYGGYGGFVEPGPFDPEQRVPAEPVDPARIATLVAADVDPTCCIGVIAMVDRTALELHLRLSIWTAVIGLLLGGLLWRLLAHGIAGNAGRASAVVAGASIATPFLILPAVVAGTPAGIAAGYLVSAAAALPLGLRVADEHPDRQWAQTARMASAVAAGLAAVVVIQYLTSTTLQNDRTVLLVLVASIAGIPAAISATSAGLPAWERVSLAAVGLMPAAAIMLIASSALDPTTAILLLGVLVIALLVAMAAARGGKLLGTRLPQIGQGLDAVSRRLDGLRGEAAVARVPTDPSIAATRDVLTYGLIGLSVFLSLAIPVGGWDPAPMGGGWPIVLGVGLAALVGFGIRRGFLGEDWTDAAVPLAAAVGIPILLVNGLAYYGRTPFAVIPTALAALSVAHVLAMRHSDPVWRTRLFGASAGLVAVIGLLAVVAALESVATILIGLVALIPGRIAFANEPGGARALTSRLETLAVAITPGIAATMLFPSLGLFMLGGWIVAMVIWRRFTLAPLLGLAQRSLIQRDVAVAAAETERARLAADLHDDALQQLTMLVRTLDEGGQKEAADEAREIATKLRSVVGDLRLPILDDLGAGAALEWLVERVEPLAGGPVKLERSDETRPPANVELAVFRVAQEALTNAIKHGKPPIAVRYDVRTDGRVTLAIDDAGEGIGSEATDEAPKEGHFGLVNMQQRAEQIGALLDVRRWPAGGTRVALEWRPQ